MMAVNSPSSPDNRRGTAIRIGWAMHVLSVAILLGVLAWGAYLYPALPDEIPIHWNAAGIADDFRPKSVGWAFGPLFIARAGADTFVAGSAIFGEQDYGAVIGAMRRNIDGALSLRA